MQKEALIEMMDILLAGKKRRQTDKYLYESGLYTAFMQIGV